MNLHDKSEWKRRRKEDRRREHDEKKRQLERIKKRKKERKNALKREKRSVRKKRRLERKRYEPLKHKIRAQRLTLFKNQLVHFLKNPLPKRKKKSKQEKLLVSAVREARFQEIIRSVIGFPGKIHSKLSFYWSVRKMQIGYLQTLWMDFYRSFGVFMESHLKRQWLVSTLNSMISFIFTFITLYFANQLITMFVASFFKIPTELYAYRIYWPLYTYSHLYTRTALIVTFGSGPMFSIIMGFTFYRLYINARNRNKKSKDLFMWGSINGFNLFLGAYITGVLTRTGFIYASEWLLMNTYLAGEEIALLVAAFISLLVTGVIFRKQFILSSPNNELIEPRFRLLFLLGKAVTAWVTGLMIVIFYTYPNIPTEYWMLPVMIIFIIVPVFIGYNKASLKKVTVPYGRPAFSINWFLGIMTVILLVLLRFILADGIIIFSTR